nr:retrotransposon protein, putative, Ty3-gypsy subclass [Tanacetum cinerariifolium]
MPFGLTNTPDVFMDLMNRVCKPYLDKFVIVFIDDILIYFRNKEEHANHLRIILELLKKEKLYAKFSECDFWIRTVQFLCHLIDSQGLYVDPVKIEAVKNWASPTTPIKIRTQLDMSTAYHPETDGQSERTILTHEDMLRACAIDFGKGWEKHLPLKELNMRQRHWVELLSDYDCEIRYHPGKGNIVADALSRKDREPLRVRSLVMTVHTNLPEKILEAQTEAMKEENVKAENLGRLQKPIFEIRSNGI